jgi:hypothetical protein
MKTFSSLLKYHQGKPPSDAQKRARSDFRNRVSGSKLKLRKASAPIPDTGKHFIIGVATYSTDELRLLDELDEALKDNGVEKPDVKVFDVLECQKMSDFDRFIPGIDGVHRTPVIGVISDGKLVDHAAGLSDVVSTLRRFHVLTH